MEDSKKRIQFKNSGIQAQAVWRLCNEIIKKRQTDAPNTETNLEIPELTCLIDQLCGPDQLVARLSADAIFLLVSSGALHMGRALDLVLAAVPSVKFLSPLVHVLHQMILNEAVSILTHSGSYECPYGLRTHIHPMISLLTHRPEAWHWLTQELDTTFRHSDLRLHVVAVEMIRPLVSFLFGEPQNNHVYNAARQGLVKSLLNQFRLSPGEISGHSREDVDINHNLQQEIIKLLLSVLPITPINTPEQIMFVVDLLSEVCDGFTSKTVHFSLDVSSAVDTTDTTDKSEKAPHSTRFSGVGSKLFNPIAATFSFSLEIIVHAVKAGVGVSRIAVMLTQLAQMEPSAVRQHADLNVLLVGEILDNAFNQEDLMTLVAATVRACSPAANMVCMASLLKPLLQMLAVPNPIGQKFGYGKSKAIAADIFLVVQQRIDDGWFSVNYIPPLPTTFLTARGLKCRFVRDLCLSLTTGNTFQKDIYNDDATPPLSHSSCDQITPDAIDIALSSWADNISELLLQRHNRRDGSHFSKDAGTVLPRLAAAVMIVSTTTATVRAACRLVQTLSHLEPTQALDFLPVILFCLGRMKEPEKKLQLLQTLPHLATHKYCVPPLLKIILGLSQSPSTRAVAITLMTKLWQHQDRIFPQLLRLLVGPQDNDHNTTDVQLAKASSILEICKQKPEQHGAELLAPLSHILDISVGQEGVAASVLALDSLYLLCQAEVMDLMSLWNVLEARLSNEHDPRPLVAARVCKLLSLLPIVALETDEYLVFTSTAVQKLWQYVQADNSNVRRAAFEALSCFKADQFKPSYLPPELTEDLRQQAAEATEHASKSNVAQPNANKDNHDLEHKEKTEVISVDELFPKIPAVCYTALLNINKFTDSETIEGLQVFLKAMVEKEVIGLPRGLYFSSAGRKQGQSLAAIDTIPPFLQQQYEKSKKSTSLRSMLAASLVFCYNPQVETGRDGRQFVVRRSNNFLQMFNELLHEVPQNYSNWRLSSLLPAGWSAFVQRLFTAVLEGRQAQIDFQEKQGTLSTAEAATEMSLAWIWTRDSIVEVIQAASRGSPNAQANSVLSLAGLAVCVQTHAAGIDSSALEMVEENTIRFKGHTQWLSTVCDTVLSLVNIEYKPKVGLLGLCQQRSTLDRAKADPVCKDGAQAAVSLLVPVLMGFPGGHALHGQDTIIKLLADFTTSLSELVTKQSSSTARKLSFWDALAPGMFLARLFEEHFSDTTGSKGMLAVWKTLTALEKAFFSLTTETTSSSDCDIALPSKSGCVLGLGLALCGLCVEGKTESRVHVTATLEKLQSALDQLPTDNPIYDVLCLSVSKLAACAQGCSASLHDVATPLMQNLIQKHGKHSQTIGVNLSLGILMSTLSKLGCAASSQLLTETAENWLKGITTEDSPCDVKISNLAGLMAMLGSEQTFIKGSSSSTVEGVSMSEMINITTKMISNNSELDLKCGAAWMLGHLHWSASQDPSSKSNVPSSYSYLPESSFLRAIVDFLLEAGRSALPVPQVLCCLQALRTRSSLPPLDWAGLLAPFMRVNSGETIRSLSIQVATRQMPKSPSATSFVSAWLTQPLFNSLSKSTQANVHLGMPFVIRSASAAVLKLYLERSCAPVFSDLKNVYDDVTVSHPDFLEVPSPRENRTNEEAAACYDVAVSVLEGLRDALLIDDPPQSVTMLLYEATGKFYSLLPHSANPSRNFVKILKAMAECLAEVPDDILDSIIAADFVDASTQLKGSFVRCHLVATGRQPVSLLNVLIDAAFNVPDWNKQLSMSLIANCLSRMSQDDITSRIQWLSELLGHTGTIASGAWPLAEEAPPLEKVIHSLTDILTCSFLMFTIPGDEDITLWGLNPMLFQNLATKKIISSTTDTSKEIDETNKEATNACLHIWLESLMINLSSYLPLAVQSVQGGPFASMTPKIIDWLLTINNFDQTSVMTKHVLHETLVSLRHVQEFKRSSVWTKAVIV